MTKTTTKFGIAALVAVLALSTVAIALSQSAVAAPANKSAFGGEGVGAIPPNVWTEIISGTIKTSTPSDLLVSHNQECTIHTGLNLDTKNEDLTSAIREDIRLVVKTEGQDDRYINPVPLYVEGADYASVTMCGQAYHIDTNILSTILELCEFAEFVNGTAVCTGDEPYFNSYIRTKAAHGWNWVIPNLGQGEHTIVIEAILLTELDGVDGETDPTKSKGPAKNTPVEDCVDKTNCVDTILEVGKRSLIVTEEKFATTVVATTD